LAFRAFGSWLLTITPILHFSTTPVFFGPVAQLVEQLTLNQLAESSSLSRPTSNIKRLDYCLASFFSCQGFAAFSVGRSRQMELLAEDVDRDDSDAVLFKIAFPGVDLIVSRYLSPFHEIIDGWVNALLPRLAFNSEQRFSFL
jgi:hypothetical protein